MKKIRLPGSWAPVSLRTKEFAPRSVLVAVDFSALSHSALERAKGIAIQFGSKLSLIHAVEPVIYPADDSMMLREMEDLNVQQVKALKGRLEAIKEELAQAGVDGKVTVKLGRPWQVIVDHARRAKCDLIVIATHGHTGPRHFLMGSTAERVVQHAPCSVLVVR